MSTSPVIIVDSHEERIAGLQALLLRRGIASHVVRSWDRAIEMLESVQDVPLALVGMGLLVKQEGDAAAAASMQLMMMGVPAILTYNEMHAFEVDMLRDVAHFSSYLEWPSSEAQVVETIAAILPDFATGDLAHTKPKRPSTGWIGLERLVEKDSETQNPVVLIDNEKDRVASIRDVLARQGLASQAFDDWVNGIGAVESTPPPLVILGYEAVMRAGPDAITLADEDLHGLGIPSILVYDAMLEFEVSMVEDECHFVSYVSWPAEDNAIATALSSVLDVDVATPDTLESESSSGFFGFDLADDTPQDARQRVPIPSLSAGNLAEVLLPRLLYFLAVQRRTGHLLVQNDAQSLKISVQDGGLVRRSGEERILSSLQAAFSWTQGTYRFEWEQIEGGQLVPLLDFIYEGISQYTSFNELLLRFVKYQSNYPAYTSLFLGRYKLLSKLGNVCDVAQMCRGQATLGELLKRASGHYDTFAPALAFCFHTDAVGVLEKPGRAPIGITYSLQSRMTSVQTAEAQRPALLGKTMMGFKSVQPTQAQIMRMSAEQYGLLAAFEKAQSDLLEVDPYDAFSLVPGCGRNAVRLAFKGFQSLIPDLSDERIPTPLRVTQRLVAGAIQDAYLLLMAEEKVDEPTALAQNASLPQSEFAQHLKTLPELFDAMFASLPEPENTLQELDIPLLEAELIGTPVASPTPRTTPPPRPARTSPPPRPRASAPSLRATPSTRPKDKRPSVVRASAVVPEPAQPVEEEPPPQPQHSAEDHFKMGMRHLDAQRFEQAHEQFRAALKADSDNGLYLAYETWTSFLLNPTAKANATRKLQKAKRMDGGLEMAIYFLGSIALQRNEFDEARRHFKRVLKQNPDNYEAQQKLRLVKMREAKKEKGGLFSKLFKDR